MFWGWRVIKDHLAACHAFVSWDEILIRPWIAPSLSHDAFANATQRIYMSATLGDGGDLERSIGISHIHRIPLPTGWDQQGSGRRLLLFPNRSLPEKQVNTAVVNLLRSYDRAILMSPSGPILNRFEAVMAAAGLPHKILHSSDIEDKLTVFTSNNKAILSVAGRYDGIDLPDDSCRIAVINGLPSTVSLQEEFLWSKLKLSKVLRDRIRTRIVQGCGRCTRNATHYAVVVLVGAKLLDFLSQTAVQAMLHPELCAEVKFGLENSDGFEKPDDLTDMAEMFLAQDERWAEAEPNILQLRSEAKIAPPEFMKTLKSVVPNEVKYQYSLWGGYFDGAFEAATGVVDALSGDDLAGYRCLWNYLAGCAAHLAYMNSGKTDKNMHKHAQERFKRAGKSVLTLPWFASLKYDGADIDLPSKRESRLTGTLIQNIQDQLSEMQYIGKRFAQKIELFQELIGNDEATEFERGLTQLGQLLGYKASKPDGQGEPDSVWSLDNQVFFLFEAKSDETASDAISISTCRQAQGHEAWLKRQPMMPGNAEIFTIVISPRSVLAREAVPHADRLYYTSLVDLRTLAGEAVDSVRTARSKASDLDAEDRVPVILDISTGNGLTHEALRERLLKTRLRDLKTR